MRLEKEPHELATVFSYVPAQIQQAISRLRPLREKLYNIYEGHKQDMIEACDREALIEELSHTDEPLSFIKLRFERFKEIKDKIRQYSTEIDSLRQRAGELMQTRERLKFLNDIIPLQAEYIPDRFDNLLKLFTSKEFTKLHEACQRRGNVQDKNKMRHIIGMLFSLVRDIEQMFNDDAAHLAETCDRFDKDYRLTVEMLYKNNIHGESPSDIDISDNLRQLQISIDKIFGKVKLIYTDIAMEETLINIKTRLAEIEDELRTLDTDIQRHMEPLEELQKSIDTKSYVFDLFWEHSLLYWNDYPQRIKNLFYYRDMINWDEAREKYALYVKITNVLSAHEELFKKLSTAFERAERAYKHAKRHYNKTKTYEANIAMQRLELNPVDVSDKVSALLAKLLLLIKNLLNNDYLDDTNKFYIDNYELATDLFINLDYVVQAWKDIFRSMFRE